MFCESMLIISQFTQWELSNHFSNIIHSYLAATSALVMCWVMCCGWVWGLSYSWQLYNEAKQLCENYFTLTTLCCNTSNDMTGILYECST